MGLVCPVLQKRVADWIWPVGHHLLGPALYTLSPLHHVIAVHCRSFDETETALVKVTFSDSVTIPHPNLARTFNSPSRNCSLPPPPGTRLASAAPQSLVSLSCCCWFFSFISSPSFFSPRLRNIGVPKGSALDHSLPFLSCPSPFFPDDFLQSYRLKYTIQNWWLLHLNVACPFLPHFRLTYPTWCLHLVSDGLCTLTHWNGTSWFPALSPPHIPAWGTCCCPLSSPAQ